MFVSFFFELRRAGVPVSLREYLTLLEGMKQGIPDFSVERFYYFSRACMVKDERWFDRFDRVFATCFEGIEQLEDPFTALPEEWLRAAGERSLSEEEKQRIKALGGFKELLETLRKRMAEQEKRHSGGSKWIGTGGTSPFGAYGYHPEGIRIGQSESRHRRAVKVWDRREFRDFDADVELGTRQMKVALRKLRRLAREGAEDEFDLDETIRATARNAGWLAIRERASRRERTKLLLFLDVGGSMDDHVAQVEQLFSAARSEFKRLETFYFHNCLYERVWKVNARRWDDVIPTDELLRTYGPDHRVVFVGDASMSPYEVVEPGGSVEHWNEESGAVWMRRARDAWPRSVWINPVPNERWQWTHSIQMIEQLMEGHMFPLTLQGIERGVSELRA